MGRHITHILITIAICGLYSIFIFDKGSIEPHNYVLISNIVSFCILLDLIVETKNKHFLKKEYFKAFSLNHFNLIFYRISNIYKKFYLWKLIAIPPILFLFIGEISMSEKLLFYTISFFQNFFTIYLFITIYDFLDIKGYDRHINIILPILSIIIIFIRSENKPELYFINPFGGIISLPIYNSGLLFYLIPSLFFIILYCVNIFYVHKQWLKN